MSRLTFAIICCILPFALDASFAGARSYELQHAAQTVRHGKPLLPLSHVPNHDYPLLQHPELGHVGRITATTEMTKAQIHQSLVEKPVHSVISKPENSNVDENESTGYLPNAFSLHGKLNGMYYGKIGTIYTSNGSHGNQIVYWPEGSGGFELYDDLSYDSLDEGDEMLRPGRGYNDAFWIKDNKSHLSSASRRNDSKLSRDKQVLTFDVGQKLAEINDLTFPAFNESSYAYSSEDTGNNFDLFFEDADSESQRHSPSPAKGDGGCGVTKQGGPQKFKLWY